VLPKKKNVAFKSFQILSNDKENINNEEEDDDEELSFLDKNVKRMFHKRERFNYYRKKKK